MFKIGRKREEGVFFAYGKHHCYGDFINLGLTNPIASAFSKWVENGVHEVRDLKNPLKKFCFWAEGPNGELVCGLLINSNDSCGREYPLITAWAGVRPYFRRCWHLAPFFCSSCWLGFEELLKENATYDDFKKSIKSVTKPENQWKEDEYFPLPKFNLKRNDLHQDLFNRFNNIDGLARKEFFNLNVGNINFSDLTVIAARFSELFKKRAKYPKAFFMGGSEDQKGIIVINRHLSITDYKYIWEI